MTWDGTITAQTILTAILIIGGYVAVVWRIGTKITTHDLRLHALEKAGEAVAETLKQVSNVLTILARQDERLNMLQREVDDLKRGRGFKIEDFNQYGHMSPGSKG